MAFTKEGIQQLTYEEVKEVFDQKQSTPILIDVRELEEYTEKHIPGIPLIPMSEIAEKAEDFKKDESYILVCRSGRRSHEVAKFFKESGIEDVSNYAGGMLEWEGPIADGEEHVVQNVNELY